MIGVWKSLYYQWTFKRETHSAVRVKESSSNSHFKLLFSYIGWILVCILTLGIGIFWVQPWMSAASCAFYEDLVAEDKAKNYQVFESGM